MTKRWTWKDSLKYRVTENYKAVFVGILCFGFLSYIFLFMYGGEREHMEFVEATIVAETVSQTRYQTPRSRVFAELDNGVRVLVSGYPSSVVNIGARVSLDHIQNKQSGYNVYKFVEYIDE